MISCSRFVHQSEFPIDVYSEPISKDFRVFINGEEIPVYISEIYAEQLGCESYSTLSARGKTPSCIRRSFTLIEE